MPALALAGRFEPEVRKRCEDGVESEKVCESVNTQAAGGRFEPEVRQLMVEFLGILFLFTLLDESYPFLLPLAGMAEGCSSAVAFLVMVPPAVGLCLFWIGSAFDHVPYTTKCCVAGVLYTAAYAWAALSGCGGGRRPARGRGGPSRRGGVWR